MIKVKEDLSIVGTYNVIPEMLPSYPIYLISRSGNPIVIQQTGVGESVSLSSFGLDELHPVKFGRKTRTGYIIFVSAIKLGDTLNVVDGIDIVLQFKVENDAQHFTSDVSRSTSNLFISGFLFGKSYEYTYRKAIEFKKANKDTKFEITNDFSKYPLTYDVFKVKNILLPYSQTLILSQTNQLSSKLQAVEELSSRVDELEKKIDEIKSHLTSPVARRTSHVTSIDLTEFLTTNYFTKMSLNKKLVKLSVEYLKEGKNVIERDVMLREFGVDDEYGIQFDIDSEKLSAMYPYLSYECLHRLILSKINKKEFYISSEEIEECRE
jgi:hypothetical protein